MVGKSIRGRVLVALVILSLVPLIVVAYQGYHCGRMAVSDLMRLHVTSVTQARRAMITGWLDERVRDVSALVQQPIFVSHLERLQSGPDPTAQTVLEGIVESIHSFEAPFESVALFDANWNPIVASKSGGHTAEDIATPAFRAGVATADSVYFDEAHLHRGRAVGTHVGRAVRNAGGEAIGFLVANLNLTQSLTPILQDRSGLWTTGKSYLIESNGQIITEPFAEGEPVALVAAADPRQLDQRDSNGEDVLIYRDHLGAEVMGASAALPYLGWTVAVEINMSEATAWVQILLFRVVAMVGVALCAVLAASAWMSGQLGSPLARLASVAHRISQGYTEERVGPMDVAEAEEVRRAVNQMLDELRDKEAELIRTATLATVGELTSSVVHEMRNPLSSIKMNLQSLSSSGASDEQNIELAEIAYEQAQRLEVMLNELLQYGRPMVLERRPADMKDLVASAVASLESVSRAHGVPVHIAVDDHASTAFVDGEQFRRALVNLIQNGIEASPRGAHVDVRIGSSGVYSGGICLTIQDEGPGFRAGHLEKLFRPFFTTKSNGIGLGLANVKKIVDLHGGVVAATNRKHGGAAFQIDLPAQPLSGQA